MLYKKLFLVNGKEFRVECDEIKKHSFAITLCVISKHT